MTVLKKRKLELLAPARDLKCGIAAVDYGADAVYMGASRFGARRAAGNQLDDIKRMVDYARPFDVKVYATLNTLIYEDELVQARDVACELIEAGVDALIIQDPAMLRMGLENVRFHASTQMSNMSAERVHFLERSGFSRVVLERNLTLEQIKEIRHATDIELECFIHGAICVACSGKCYMSRSMGVRSGNRGDCSQPCRLTYDLENESGDVLSAGRHFLSVKDLDLSVRIGALIDAGIDSFKIEGRLKDEAYVKNIVLYYSRILDSEISRREGIMRASSGHVFTDFEPAPEKTFSRGGTIWMLDGPAKNVSSMDTPKSVGTYVGKVMHVSKDYFVMDSPEMLSAGDGITLVVGGEVKGTYINKVVGTKIYPNKIKGIEPGKTIYRNYDHSFYTALKNMETKRVIDVFASVRILPDRFEISVKDEDNIVGEAVFIGSVEPADKPDKMAETIRRQILKSGDTIFFIKDVAIHKEQSNRMPFLPVTVINHLRREALEDLFNNRLRYVEESRICRTLPVEDTSFKHNQQDLDGSANIVNHLSEKFYRDHGVEGMETGYDMLDDFTGVTVMTTPYCLRRELGICLRDGSPDKKYAENLFLRRGTMKYRLDFDCTQCMMNVIKVQ